MTLTEFLLARIEEERQLAWSAVGLTPAGRPGMGWQVDEDGALLPNPPRLIEECETKRRIVEMLGPESAMPATWGSEDVWFVAQSVLEFLVLPYADHPDFNPGWTTDAPA